MRILFEELAVVFQSSVVVDGLEDEAALDCKEEELFDLWCDVALVSGYMCQEVAKVDL
jgi:hypothetical protein